MASKSEAGAKNQREGLSQNGNRLHDLAANMSKRLFGIVHVCLLFSVLFSVVVLNDCVCVDMCLYVLYVYLYIYICFLVC